MQHRIFRRKTRCDATWRRLAPKKRASVISAYVDGCTDRNVICDGFSAAEQQRTRGLITREIHVAANCGSRGEHQELSAGFRPNDDVTIL